MKLLRALLLALLAFVALPGSATLPMVAGPRHVAQAPSGGGDSALAQACENLSVGATTTYAPATGHGLSEAQLEWQSIGYHDTLHNALVLFGKEANNDTDWRMRRMDLEAETWSSHDFTALNRSGHIYGGWTIEYATGDAWATPGQNASGNEPDLFKYTYATDTWALHEAEIYVAVNARPTGGIAVHPNLYGTGNAGVVDYDLTGQLGIYRIDNDTIQVIDTDELPGATSGLGVYWPANDQIIVGSAQHLRVRPNGGGTPLWDVADAPPIATRGTTSGTSPNFGALLVHPGNANKLMILRRGGDQQVWTREGATSWATAGTHPIDAGSGEASIWISLRDDIPCALNIRQNGGTGTATLWRPTP